MKTLIRYLNISTRVSNTFAFCQQLSIFFSEFKPEAVPEDLDAVIIGSGISSLATAVMLGRAGKRVLVLEQIKRTGGGCHTYKKKGYEFDTGRIN